MKNKFEDLEVYLAYNILLWIMQIYFFLLKKGLIHKDDILEHKFKKTSELYQEYKKL